MPVDPHIQALRDALVAEHEARIAEVERQADEAADDWHRKFHQDRVAELRAMPWPWETAERRSA